MTDSTQIRARAIRAEQLLGDPLLQEMFDAAEHDAIEQLLRLRDPAANLERVALIERVHAIRELPTRLGSLKTTEEQAARPKPRVA